MATKSIKSKTSAEKKSTKKTVKSTKPKKAKAVKKIAVKAIKPAKLKTTAKKKTVIKKLVIKKTEAKEKKLGKILNYYDKIKVIAIKLKSELSVGDTIRIKGGEDTDFKQKITSMEINGVKVKKAKKNQGIGLKIKGKARAGYWVYKI
ncbi:MAG: hypothetical protein WCX74_00395 [Candidatus Paceibacterota bacterium]